MIKVKNVDDKSRLHKVTIPVTFISGSSLTASYLGYGIVPVACTLEKVVINAHADVTGSNGTNIIVTNKFTGSAAISTTIHSQIATQLDWSANSPQVLIPSSDKYFSALTPFTVLISGTVGTMNLYCFAQFDIDDKQTK